VPTIHDGAAPYVMDHCAIPRQSRMPDSRNFDVVRLVMIEYYIHQREMDCSATSLMAISARAATVPLDRIAQSILILRGHRVILDSELAALYGVATKVLLQAVKRNRERFPDDFTLRLTAQEWELLRSQTVTLKTGSGRHRKYLPYAFTEQGVAMLSSVLHSARAIAVNVQIMRAFVRMRELLVSNKALG
jgi:hypothetical protein